MRTVSGTWLLRIELPEYTLRLCDGGWIPWDGQKFVSEDPVFGAIISADVMEEGVGNEVPALQLEFAPPASSAPSALSQPGFQRSLCHFWFAEYDMVTGLVTGTPQLQFYGQIDLTTVRISGGVRTVPMGIVSTAERLFTRNIGNTLSPAAHKANNPGEKGHDNATGLKVSDAWGAEAPGGSSSRYAGGGFSGQILRAVLSR